MKLVPNKGRVVVKVDDPKEKIGLIVLPDSAKEKQRTGKVIAINPVESSFSEGNRVFFNHYEGTPININNEDFLVFKEDNIYGTIQE